MNGICVDTLLDFSVVPTNPSHQGNTEKFYQNMEYMNIFNAKERLKYEEVKYQLFVKECLTNKHHFCESMEKLKKQREVILA